jgi:hypothetical protein
MEVRAAAEKRSIGLFFDNNCPLQAVRELRDLAPEGMVIEHAFEENLYHQIPDTTLAGYCRGKNVVFVTADKRIRTTPFRIQAYHEMGIGYVEVRATGTGERKLSVYRKHFERFLKVVEQPVPFCYQVNPDRFFETDLLAKIKWRERSRDRR